MNGTPRACLCTRVNVIPSYHVLAYPWGLSCPPQTDVTHKIYSLLFVHARQHQTSPRPRTGRSTMRDISFQIGMLHYNDLHETFMDSLMLNCGTAAIPNYLDSTLLAKTISLFLQLRLNDEMKRRVFVIFRRQRRIRR